MVSLVLRMFWVVLILLRPNGCLTGAHTEPVGAMRIRIAGNGGTTLVNAGGFIHSAEHDGVGHVFPGGILFDPEANWPEDHWSLTYYVQLGSGDWAGIEANTANQLSLAREVPAGEDLPYRIIPFNTLKNLFGSNNRAGFTAGDTIGTADILIFWDNIRQTIGDPIYFNSVTGGWMDVWGNEASGTILYPDGSLLVLGLHDHGVTISGKVQNWPTSGKIAGSGALSFLPNPYPWDLFIGNSGLERFLSGGVNPLSSDLLARFDRDRQIISRLYYFDLLKSRWRDVLDRDLDGSDIIPPGDSLIIIKHSTGETGWTLNPGGD